MSMFLILAGVIGTLVFCLVCYADRKSRRYRRAMQRWEYDLQEKAKELGYDLDAKDGMYHTKMMILKGEVGEEPDMREYL